jgi:hypothetical protein
MLLAATALPLAAQERKGLVEIDHASGNARFIYFDGRRTDTTDVGVNPTVRVPRGVNVQVRVIGTNSALYRFSTADEKVPVPDFQSVMSLVVRSAPYVPELGSVAGALGSRGGGEDVAEAMAALAEADRRVLSEASEEMNAALERMNRARQGRSGVQQVLTATLSSLDRMRLGEVPEVASGELRALLPQPVSCGADAPVRINAAQELLAGVFQAARAQSALRDAIAGPAYPEQLSWKAAYDSALVTEKRSKDVLADFDELVTNSYEIVYRLERLVGIVAGACSRVDVAIARPELSGGRAVKVDAVPRGESELIRLADYGSDSWTVTVLPRVLFSPSVSIGGLAAPQGRLPLYGTAPNGAGREVVQTGSTDARFTAAGMLGLTYGFLDRREIDGFAIWLPEIVMGAGSTPTFGVGAAVSYKFMRLGVGGAWMRYRGLNGVAEGSIIGDPSELRTTDTYGKPRMYLTLSVFDWSPLAARLQ